MPRTVDQILEAYNSILYPVYQSALPKESRQDPHFLGDVLEEFKDVLRGQHLARLGIAEAEGKTADFLRDTFARFLKGNNDFLFREGERRRTNLFFTASGARDRLNLRRSVYNQYMDWAGELVHELYFSDLNDNTVRHRIQLLARRLEVFVKETAIIGRFIQEQYFPVSNEDMEYYVLLAAQHDIVANLETPVVGLRRFYSTDKPLYGEKETAEVSSWFNEFYLQSVNPFAFIATLGRFFEFYNNQIRINGPAGIPSIVPENPNFVRVVIEEVVLAAARKRNPSVSVDFAWDAENKDLLMDIRGVTLKDFVEMIRTSSSIAKSLGLSGRLPAEILSSTYFRLLLNVPLADGTKSVDGGSGSSGAVPNDPVPPASPVSGSGAGSFASAMPNAWIPFNAGAALFSSGVAAVSPVTAGAIL